MSALMGAAVALQASMLLSYLFVKRLSCAGMGTHLSRIVHPLSLPATTSDSGQCNGEMVKASVQG